MKCICTEIINGKPDAVVNPDCPLHGSLSHKPKMMKRYSEDCKPTVPGWYWAGYVGGMVSPAYYSGSIWHAFDCVWREILYEIPHFWHEMENSPTIPKGEA